MKKVVMIASLSQIFIFGPLSASDTQNEITSFHGISNAGKTLTFKDIKWVEKNVNDQLAQLPPEKIKEGLALVRRASCLWKTAVYTYLTFAPGVLYSIYDHSYNEDSLFPPAVTQAAGFFAWSVVASALAERHMYTKNRADYIADKVAVYTQAKVDEKSRAEMDIFKKYE